MATTKETMKVIAKGLDEDITVQITEHEEEYGLSDVEELAEQIVFEIAEKTGVDFVLFAEEADPECIDLVIKLLEKRFFSSFTHALRTIFLAEGWDDAVWRLDLLDTCYENDENAGGRILKNGEETVPDAETDSHRGKDLQKGGREGFAQYQSAAGEYKAFDRVPYCRWKRCRRYHPDLRDFWSGVLYFRG